ncbi:hypothetical protein Pmani_005629 [Petrolisthes manimaculis]|uniref:C2H2-type domain-containing protein n=1 Tax=Petrolisthes manimaculis TaxID=1843537 RepID=A0AAE1QDF6_9EUCA|nr:hypothetical protein Pmani_005629 [Petrolisthes manimaculis]
MSEGGGGGDTCASNKTSLTNRRKILPLLQCPLCSFTSVNHTLYTEHCRSHINEDKPFSCPECSYQTSDPSHLKRHIRIHTGEKPYSCPHCPYRSSENAKVKRHLLTHK